MPATCDLQPLTSSQGRISPPRASHGSTQVHGHKGTRAQGHKVTRCRVGLAGRLSQAQG